MGYWTEPPVSFTIRWSARRRPRRGVLANQTHDGVAKHRCRQQRSERTWPPYNELALIPIVGINWQCFAAGELRMRTQKQRWPRCLVLSKIEQRFLVYSLLILKKQNRLSAFPWPAPWSENLVRAIPHEKACRGCWARHKPEAASDAN